MTACTNSAKGPISLQLSPSTSGAPMIGVGVGVKVGSDAKAAMDAVGGIMSRTTPTIPTKPVSEALMAVIMGALWLWRYGKSSYSPSLTLAEMCVMMTTATVEVQTIVNVLCESRMSNGRKTLKHNFARPS